METKEKTHFRGFQRKPVWLKMGLSMVPIIYQRPGFYKNTPRVRQFGMARNRINPFSSLYDTPRCDMLETPCFHGLGRPGSPTSSPTRDSLVMAHMGLSSPGGTLLGVVSKKSRTTEEKPHLSRQSILQQNQTVPNENMPRMVDFCGEPFRGFHSKVKSPC